MVLAINYMITGQGPKGAAAPFAHLLRIPNAIPLYVSAATENVLWPDPSMICSQQPSATQEPQSRVWQKDDGKLVGAVSNHHDKGALAQHFREATPHFSEVPSINAADLTVQDFHDQYVAHNVPIVLRGAAAAGGGWPPAETWSDERLKALCGHRAVQVRCQPRADGTFGDPVQPRVRSHKLYDFATVPFADFIDSWSKQTPSASAKPLYAARIDVPVALPELRAIIPGQQDSPWRTAFGNAIPGLFMYAGQGGQGTPLHFDELENMNFVVRGSKRYRLLPPSATPLLYPVSQPFGGFYSAAPPAALNAGTPEAAAFPDTQNATVFDVTLHAGDALYLPACWWHAVSGGDGPNISFIHWYFQRGDKADHAAWRRHVDNVRLCEGDQGQQLAKKQDWNAQHGGNSR